MLRLIGVGGGNLPSPLMIFKHICYRHNHHILTFQTSRDTWPAAFHFVFSSPGQSPGRAIVLLLASASALALTSATASVLALASA